MISKNKIEFFVRLQNIGEASRDRETDCSSLIIYVEFTFSVSNDDDDDEETA